MALHISDPETELAVRRLAASRGLTLTEAVRQACLEALRLELRNRPLKERLDSIYRLVNAAPLTGEVADKAFFDEIWGDGDEAPQSGAANASGRDLSDIGGSASRAGRRNLRRKHGSG